MTSSGAVAQYIVEPAFYSNDQCILVNQATWQRLPPDLQKLLTETMIEVERDSDFHRLARFLETDVNE